MLGALLKRTAPTHFATAYKLGHDEAFHLLEARRGRGKSFTMTYWALQVAREKIPVVANFHINPYWLGVELVQYGTFRHLDEAVAWCEANVRYVNSWDEIMLSYDCLILIDEVNRLFDAQDRSKEDRAPKVVFEWLQLSRRNKITLVFAAQSMDWLTPRVRQLFDYLWRAKKELHPKGKKRGQIKQFWLYGGDPWAKGLNAAAQREADYKATVPFDKRIWRLYDTRERIQAIPSESAFTTFFEIYQHQLETGIVPPAPAPLRRSLSYAEYEALWDSIAATSGHGRAGAAEAESAVREQPTPAPLRRFRLSS